MVVKELIEKLKALPQHMTVATHPAGLSIWMESNYPRIVPVLHSGQQTCDELANKYFVVL